MHVATRGPARTTGDLPGVHADHPFATHPLAARPVGATAPPTADTDAHRPRLMKLEAIASLEGAFLTRAPAQDFISTDNAFKADPTPCRLAEDELKVVARG